MKKYFVGLVILLAVALAAPSGATTFRPVNFGYGNLHWPDGNRSDKTQISFYLQGSPGTSWINAYQAVKNAWNSSNSVTTFGNNINQSGGCNFGINPAGSVTACVTNWHVPCGSYVDADAWIGCTSYYWYLELIGGTYVNSPHIHHVNAMIDTNAYYIWSETIGGFVFLHPCLNAVAPHCNVPLSPPTQPWTDSNYTISDFLKRQIFCHEVFGHGQGATHIIGDPGNDSCLRSYFGGSPQGVDYLGSTVANGIINTHNHSDSNYGNLSVGKVERVTKAERASIREAMHAKGLYVTQYGKSNNLREKGKTVWVVPHGYDLRAIAPQPDKVFIQESELEAN